MHKTILKTNNVLAQALDPAMKLYFAVAAAMTLAAAISGILALGLPGIHAFAFIAITGCIWNYLDSAGGMTNAIKELTSKTQSQKKQSRKKGLAIFNLLWSVVMATVTTISISALQTHLWAGLATLTFSVAMLGCMLESLNNYLETPDKKPIKKQATLDICAWGLACVGAAFMTPFAWSGNSPALMWCAMVGGSCYALAGLLKLIQLTLKSSNSSTSSYSQVETHQKSAALQSEHLTQKNPSNKMISKKGKNADTNKSEMTVHGAEKDPRVHNTKIE